MKKDKKDILIKFSGDFIECLISNEDNEVMEYIKDFTKDYDYAAALVGGGIQITRALKAKYPSYKPEYTRSGSRILVDKEQLEIQEQVLKENQKFVQDVCKRKGIDIDVDIPYRYIGKKKCPENADDTLKAVAHAFTHNLVVTLEGRGEEKKFEKFEFENLTIVEFDQKGNIVRILH